MSRVESALAKVGIASAVAVLILVRTRRVPREQMGFVKPSLSLSLLFVAVYLGWMLASNAVLNWRGAWNWQPWLDAPLLASVLRVLAVGIIGPIAEELIFRGFLYGRLLKYLGTALTILVTAAGWAALHYMYDWPVMGVIFVDGILLGLARWRTRSVFPPMVMHALYNLYAIW